MVSRLVSCDFRGDFIGKPRERRFFSLHCWKLNVLRRDAAAVL